MRIRLFSLNYKPERSGIAPYTTGLAVGLAQRGHRVEVFTSLPHYPEWHVDPADRALAGTLLRSDGVSVRRFSHYVPNSPTLIRRFAFESAFGFRVASHRWDETDLILTVSPSLIASAMVIARARSAGIPTGLIAQDLYGQGVVETGALSGTLARRAARFEKAVFDAASGVSVIHDRFKATAVDMGVDPRHVTTIRNWAHVDAPATANPKEVRLRHGWSPHERIVLHSGNMGAKQGLENVIDAARCADHRGTNIRFVLMGGGNQRPALEAAAAGVCRIEFKDLVDDEEYRQVLAAADVLLANERPGIAEMAVPSKLTSYFAAGRPVLAATDPHGVLAGEVRDSGAGLVVAAGDPAALLDAALHLTDHPDVGTQCGLAGRRYAERLLGAEHAIDQYEAWCQRLTRADVVRPARIRHHRRTSVEAKPFVVEPRNRSVV